MKPEVKAIADHALLVTFARKISEEAHDAVLALDAALAERAPSGMIETVPAMVNLLVSFDPVATDHESMATHVRACLGALENSRPPGAAHRVPICYEAPFSPDLEAVSVATGLTPEAVINAHLSGCFRVLMYGFAPGYAYLSGVPEAIHVPRKPVPLRDVAAGSVIIAGPQCLITTLVMPTGWSIIGRSPTRILTGDAKAPFLFDVADSVRFERIDAAGFARLDKAGADG